MNGKSKVTVVDLTLMYYSVVSPAERLGYISIHRKKPNGEQRAFMPGVTPRNLARALKLQSLFLAQLERESAPKK